MSIFRALFGGKKKKATQKKIVSRTDRKTSKVAKNSKRSAKVVPRKRRKRKAGSTRPKRDKKEVKPTARLEKSEENPVIQPDTEHPWETKAVFNPAAIYEDGKVHMAYRAIGDSDRSVLGYASSEDGIHFEGRLDDPMYIPRAGFEGSVPVEFRGTPTQSSSPYISGGGGWGGVEDPRMTRIGDRIYMTYVAYDGWNPPRVALTSIALSDFLSKKWKWTEPVLISEPGVVNKNTVIFPEKVNGKYVIFHRIFPDILIDFVDDLDFDGKTKWLKTMAKIRPRKNYWDSRKLGAGPPPIKTDRGWLLIYQAVGNQDAGRYKIGAMLLDLKDPSKVIARSKKPILEPDEWYENEGWKSGVAYPCGAAVKEGMLFIYYGGADTVVCVASAKLDEFLDQLQTTKEPRLRKHAKAKRKSRKPV